MIAWYFVAALLVLWILALVRSVGWMSRYEWALGYLRLLRDEVKESELRWIVSAEYEHTTVLSGPYTFQQAVYVEEACESPGNPLGKCVVERIQLDLPYTEEDLLSWS